LKYRGSCRSNPVRTFKNPKAFKEYLASCPKTPENIWAPNDPHEVPLYLGEWKSVELPAESTYTAGPPVDLPEEFLSSLSQEEVLKWLDYNYDK
jgi:hypothetical protein